MEQALKENCVKECVNSDSGDCLQRLLTALSLIIKSIFLVSKPQDFKRDS